jgi:hypothetical protein
VSGIDTDAISGAFAVAGNERGVFDSVTFAAVCIVIVLCRADLFRHAFQPSSKPIAGNTRLAESGGTLNKP